MSGPRYTHTLANAKAVPLQVNSRKGRKEQRRRGSQSWERQPYNPFAGLLIGIFAHRASLFQVWNKSRILPYQYTRKLIGEQVQRLINNRRIYKGFTINRFGAILPSGVCSPIPKKSPSAA